MQLYFGHVAYSKSESEAFPARTCLSKCELFDLESNDVKDTDILLTNDKDKRECCLVEAGYCECVSLVNIGCVWVINALHCGPVEYQVYMGRKPSH